MWSQFTLEPSMVVDLSSWNWLHFLNFDLMDGDFNWSMLNAYVVAFNSLKYCPHLSPGSHLINILCNNKQQGQEQLQHPTLFYHEIQESFFLNLKNIIYHWPSLPMFPIE
jgi:hypothetical protein